MIKVLSRLIIVSLFTFLYSCEEDENKLPVPDFTADKTIVATGESVNFTDLTKYNPKTWLWNFGDESNSTLQNPTHSYKYEGKYYVHLYTENENGANYIKKNEFITVYQKTEILTDSRDNKTYKTIKIGNQWWMAENLNYNMEGSYAYNNNEEYAATYGRLYDWPLASNACPDGWHLPSKNEFQTLLNYINTVHAQELMAVSNLWNYNYCIENPRANNKTGFSALPGGAYIWGFLGINDEAAFWTSSLYNNHPFHYYIVSCGNDGFTYFTDLDNNDTFVKYSVRCIKD